MADASKGFPEEKELSGQGPLVSPIHLTRPIIIVQISSVRKQYTFLFARTVKADIFFSYKKYLKYFVLGGSYFNTPLAPCSPV